MLEEVAMVGIAALKKELEEENKATYKYLSISGEEFSYDHCPDSVKRAMLGKMASYDLAESSFAGVTAQLQSFGQIAMGSAAAISDAKRYQFFYRPIDNKSIKKGDLGMFHTLPEELQVTATISAMESAPQMRKKNNKARDRQREIRELKAETEKAEGREMRGTNILRHNYCEIQIQTLESGRGKCLEIGSL
ncbi:hypothetical protein ACHAWF_017484 [Thalassiosira exigua]